MIYKIFLAIHYCFYIYMTMIVVRCLLTWFPNINWESPLFNGLRSATDLYLDLFKKFIPPVGMFDLSPMVAMIALIFLERVCYYVLAYGLALMGVLR